MESTTNNMNGGLRVLISGAANKANAGLFSLISDIDGVQISGVTTTLVDMLRATRETRPDVVLLDHVADGINFLAKIRMLKDIVPELLIIVLTHEVATPLRRRCLEHGAAWVLDKTAELDKLIEVLHRLGGGVPAEA